MSLPKILSVQNNSAIIISAVDLWLLRRWGNTPMDEAVHFGHHDVVTILRDYHAKYSPQESPKDQQSAEKNLDGML